MYRDELYMPLTSIRAFAEILRDNPNLAPEELRRFSEIIVSESERLTRRIEEHMLCQSIAGSA